LQKLCFRERRQLKENVLEYKSLCELNNPHMGELADVVFGVPATQVAVERSFNALAIVLTPHRTRLSDDNVSAILKVKLNNDLLNEINLNDFR
jgi:hypothetical protein